jgi:hypothetical protein
MMTDSCPAESIQHFARTLADWEFLAEWLFWPPDVFALTSLVLTRTGCYRQIVARHPQDDCPNWAELVDNAARAWQKRLGDVLAGEASSGNVEDSSAKGAATLFGSVDEDLRLLTDCGANIEALGHVTLERLSVLDPGDHEAERLTRQILTLHAIADEACQGLGYKPYGRGINLNRVTLPHCLGNLLLTSTGSLSVLPRRCGIVLPKLRTPQGGLSIRSFSHHVTFHESEVAVMWRSVPTANMDEDTLNLLLVPWPSSLDERSFTATRDQFEVVRYFGFSPQSDDRFKRRVDALMQLLQELDGRLSRIHLLVFPECALAAEEFDTLLRRLRDMRESAGDGRATKRLKSLPMVIAGVRENNDPGHLREGQSHNEVRIASYFAGQWYVLSQRKHHRWKLDRDQIRMYGLEGRLPTQRNWFEDITLTQRRLTFLAPAGWLTLCPLVCEDLARSDPVSEIVRGVGPALLTALLLDGPQLKVRWPARYAGVFADDPGTAVVTLTARGLARRSAVMENDVRVPPKGDRQVVSLFKDQVRGAYELAVEGEGEQLILLTLTATMREEYTADGRGGHNAAPVFQYEGHRVCQLALKDERLADTAPKESAAGLGAGVGRSDDPARTSGANAADEREKSGIESAGGGDERGREDFGDWFDIREMTATLYVIDAALRLDASGVQTVLAWLSGSDADGRRTPLPLRLQEIENRLMKAQRDPASFGIRARHPGWPSTTLLYVVERLQKYFDDVNAEKATGIELWKTRIALARKWLEPQEPDGAMTPATGASAPEARGRDARLRAVDQARLDRAVPLAVLCSLHDRLSLWRAPFTLSQPHPEGSLTPLEAASLLADVERLLDAHS